MIDFIEYVVSELKSKRLSKSNALALIEQFSHHSATANVAVMHPLVHSNISDLNQQGYLSKFTGEEFFLRDHQIQGKRVLPAVAYLEMVRAAMASALPDHVEGTTLELRNVVWAQPVVVSGHKEVALALSVNEEQGRNNDQVDFEIYSYEETADRGDGGSASEVIHCQGQAVFTREPAPPRCDLEKLQAQMTKGRLDSATVYSANSQEGINIGPAHQGVKMIHQGERQQLAHISLPDVVHSTHAEYVLHPSIMDSVLQAATGLIIDMSQHLSQPPIPFALDSLQVFSACKKEMFAWARYSPGSRREDKVVKLDIDMCDSDGNVCVRMLGYSSRVLSTDISVQGEQGKDKSKNIGLLLALPEWEARDMEAAPSGMTAADCTEQRIILCDLPNIDPKLLHGSCLELKTTQQTMAGRYSEVALACFEEIQTLLSKLQGKTLVQVVVSRSDMIFAGLFGLLKTAAKENPQLTGQVIIAEPEIITDELAVQLRHAQRSTRESIVKYENGKQYVQRWRTVDESQTRQDKPKLAFKDGAVYLITGGLGGLGMLFAREILQQTRDARVILTGRSALTAAKEAVLDELSAGAVQRVFYRQLDVGDLDQVKQFIAASIEEFGRIDGIMHCAGMISDAFILKKTADQFRQVLEPKVAGAFNLDEASKDLDLDFLVLFSGGASVFGNAGQADYAAANGFMDQFAVCREQWVSANTRKGLTVSINWPLWQDGGMRIDPASQRMLQQTTGMHPMRTATGMRAFYQSLELKRSQVLVGEGELELFHRVLLAEQGIQAAGQAAGQVAAADNDAVPVEINSDDLVEKTQGFLRKQFSAVLKLPAHRIDPLAPLENYGIDSILAMNLTSQLELTFGSLPKTLFFEYQTVRELTEYFVRSHAEKLASLFDVAKAGGGGKTPSQASPQALPEVPAKPVSARRASGKRFRRQGGVAGASSAPSKSAEPIAIVGLSGRYPGAYDIEEYWANLRDGKDCIVEIPADRWDWREYYSEDRNAEGRHYSKWGGFIDGVDEFDALFFNVPPVDAERTDPQERLFLQHSWMALEDAGYTRASLQVPREKDQAGQVGVYVGVMYGEYQLFGAEKSLFGNRMVTPSSYASIANRLSYFLNLHGPSMAVDTMCSSSLTAIHLACQDLKQGRTDVAIAGGVNVTVHPSKYLLLSSGQFIASDGRCESFGEGGDGYIPGEGVGAVILKRLSDAEKDGNHIYGVIKGSALNHGGKTNGYSVPSPQSQSSVIGQALKEFGVDPRHISYLEAHGTGTKLGDPIEIAALTQVFRQYTPENQFCLIGSAKSNIGHAESAAGIAGLTKVLLQMKHRQIVPSLHSSVLNPHIDFEKTPFIVNQTLREWEQPEVNGRRVPRIAGISSFGAGGSNAHLIVEEYTPADTAALPEVQHGHGPAIILLSARAPEQLKQRILDLLAFIRRQEHPVDLHSMAYTLQMGREMMEERFGLLVNSIEQLAERLQAYADGEQNIEDCYQGQAKRGDEALSLFNTDADLQETIDKWIASGKLSRVLELWAKGLEVDWNKFHGEIKPRFISLPTYSFAKVRCWTDRVVNVQAATKGTAAAVLHPLLHVNTSDFSQQSYRSTFTGSEFFLADHRVSIGGGVDQKVLPGVAYLEMARAAIEQALPARPESAVLELRNIVWAQPLVVVDHKQVSIVLSAHDDGQIDFEIHSQVDDDEIVHCQGRAAFSAQPASLELNLGQLKEQMQRGSLSPNSVYDTYARMGLAYGQAHRGITSIALGEKQLLAQLRIPPVIETNQAEYLLHPSLMDGALQAAIGLFDVSANASARLPFALNSLHIVAPCTTEMFAWVRYSPGSGPLDNVVKLDIDLCDSQGNVCVKMREFSSRALGKELGSATVPGEAIGSLIARPVWQEAAASLGHSQREYAEHHVILCDLPGIDEKQLEALLPGSRCLALQAPPESALATRYSQHALACFEKLRTILEGAPQAEVLVQIVLANSQEQAVLAGLSGMLKTAAQENPRLVGQVILTAPGTTTQGLAGQLQDNKRSPEALIKYEQDARQVLRWQEMPTNPGTVNVAFKDHGVYLITGGLGGLGVLFAKEILAQTPKATIILTGRAALNAEKQAILDTLSTAPGQLEYRMLDLEDLEQVRQLIDDVTKEHKQLNGILHSAGMVADNFILKKSAEEFSQVLAPKVTGTVNLDQATQHIDLDFFALFSSVTSAMGNVGQADYAAANGFMDQYAAYRNELVATRQRKGRTLSINWPLWLEGGMRVDPATAELLQEATGVQPMHTATGMQALYRSLDSQHSQTLVLEGDLARLRHVIAGQPQPQEPAPVPVRVEQPAALQAEAPHADADSLVEKTEAYLRKQFSNVLKVPSHKIDPQAPLENYGIDSILAMKLTNQLEKTFGSLSKTLFFEYQTIAKLGGYLLKAFPEVVRKEVGFEQSAAQTPAALPTSVEKLPAVPAIRGKNRFLSASTHAVRQVAIVGLSGRYPQAENLDEFWENLKSGLDCISEIPSDRWDHALYFDEDRNKAGKSYTKWGGFLADVDKFDPLFFNISPKEAEIIDPQERLFLETAWETLEDAGYSKEGLAGKRVGVYVGAMWGHYELFGAGSISGANPVVPTSSHASIANRVSYFFNFNGPSIALDTMCSSSLTAIHLASEEIRRGNIDAALAGGVNLSVHPQKYLSLSQGKFAASDGRCRSFGQGGDGYVPGEGVGAVLLKPLDDALRDGDHVYAVIESSAVNHGGKTNGYTVPNPNAQGELILEALNKANIDPRTLGYIETHGTGTSLGDPIEITGMQQAFAGFTDEKKICPIGSVKSNIGHLESAAGIAAVTKALLQIKYGQLVPSLHAEPLNPNINFDESPFYVQTELAQWQRRAGHPRRVAVSSFGAGGSNAHLILAEHVNSWQAQRSAQPVRPEVFVLSARDQNALYRYAARVAKFLARASGDSLIDMAYTSQVGRTSMPARLAVIATSVEELKDKLDQWVASRTGTDRGLALNGMAEPDDVFYGNVNDAQYNAGNLIQGAAGKAFLRELLVKRDLASAAKLWAVGADIDWALAYADANPGRVSLPTYPFAKERYWVDAVAIPPGSTLVNAKATPKAGEEKRRVYYHPQWKVRQLAVSAPPATTGPILVLDTTEAFFEAIRAKREEDLAENPIVLARLGSAYEEVSPDSFTIDPEREEDFDRLVEALKASGRLPRLILHRCADAGHVEQSEQQVAQQLNQGVYTLLHACKALMKQKHHTSTKMVSFFSGGSQAAAALGAALGGFYKTLHLENPKYVSKVVNIRLESGVETLSVADEVGILLEEIHDDAWATSEICYRYTDRQTCVRHVREYVSYKPLDQKTVDLPLKQHGVYLITGGLGGLGFILAGYLAKNFKAKLALVGRSELSTANAPKIDQLKAQGAEILYLRGDAAKLADMESVVRETKARFGRIDGVIHSAGVNRDSFILKKTREDMAGVLDSKVHGAINLDLATREESLDLFVLFSSVAGVLGNLGQCDYAYANHFLDSYAEERESLRLAGRRNGRTLSINWPFWQEGGMTLSRDAIASSAKYTGMYPLPTEEGLRAWEDLLRSALPQGIALYGAPSRIAAYVTQGAVQANLGRSAVAKTADPATLLARTEAYLKALIGAEIKLTPERIDSRERLESFGLDSIMVGRLNDSLTRDLGPLPKTLFYEYETIDDLAKYFVREVPDVLTRVFGQESAADATAIDSEYFQPIDEVAEPAPETVQASRQQDDAEPIAIIGVHGYYPQSKDLDEYWEHLRQGHDLVGLIPADRWDCEQFYDADPEKAAEGKIYCKWGAFLEDHDKFDASFFNIEAEEARMIDPQERLFLQSVWSAIEDAGYTRESLKRHFPKARSADVGVFVGVTTNSYQMLTTEEWQRGNIVSPSAMPWSIANRISYFFDFQGPSMPVDTACSSCSVAIHLACESLRKHECQVAIAGGVNLYLHPTKYHGFCQKRMLAVGGRCRSYGAGDDGFVPGEGVGTLFLKPLSRAVEDGDHIYATILGSAYDHSGRSNGYSAPNPNSQASIISKALSKAGVHPESISYVEGHGTGTQLGDSLEISALAQAFRKQTEKRQFCAVGSVKANLGHSESAAGISGVTKILLQMKHRQLAPTIHSHEVNPDIEFDRSPFYLQHGLSPWEPSSPHPRRALINSFGAGGVNACVVLEEYEQLGTAVQSPAAGPHLVVLSAKNEERLREYADKLLARVRKEAQLDLAAFSYTLQVGREAMPERLALIVADVQELMDTLDAWIRREPSVSVYRGSLDPRRGAKMPTKKDKEVLESLLEARDLSGLAQVWTAGGEVEWERLYAQNRPFRMSLPTYPFAKERYWVSEAPAAKPRLDAEQKTAQLHPLISHNSSTLREVSFSSMLSGNAFYARDHQVNGHRIFPGAGYLEMACVSAAMAGTKKVSRIRDVVFIQPLVFRDESQMIQISLRPTDDNAEYIITSYDADREKVVHSEGLIDFQDDAQDAAGEEYLPIEALKKQCAQPADVAHNYGRFEKTGISYGPSFRTMQELYIGNAFALSKLVIADHLRADFDDFVLHPCMIDGALQTVSGMAGGGESSVPFLPFAIDEVQIFRPTSQTCYVHVEEARLEKRSSAEIKKFNIKITNEKGLVLVSLKNFSVRAFKSVPSAGMVNA